MFDYLGRWAVRHPWLIVSVWLGLAIATWAVAPNWQRQSQDDDIRFLPSTYPSVRGYQLLEQAFPKDVFACRVIFAAERADGPLTGADWTILDRCVGRLNELRTAEPELQITGIHSYKDAVIGSRLTSADRRCSLIQVSLATPYLALQTRATVDRTENVLQALLTDSTNDGLRVYTTGPGGVGRDLIDASAKSLDHTTLATVILVVGVLLLVYRAPIMAFIPLFTIGVAVWVSLQLLALVTLIPGVHLVNISQVFAIVILFGAGTDYCLFLISRYREELEAGETAPVALHRGVRAVGGALAASAATVICGLAMMGFADFGKIRCAGPVIALALAVGLAASLTLTPALLRLCGRWAFWPQVVQPIAPGARRNGFWEWMSHIVVQRPAWVFTLALLPLIPLAVLGLRVVPTFKPTGDLSPTASSVRGLAVLQKHFTAGETGPITVLLSSKTDWTSTEGRALIDYLSSGFAYLSNVAEVRSLARPLGQIEDLRLKNEDSNLKPQVNHQPSSIFNLQSSISNLQSSISSLQSSIIQQRAQQHYVTRVDGAEPLYFTRLEIVLKSDPFDPASVSTLEQVEWWLREVMPKHPLLKGSLQAECYGVTVQTRDMAVVVARDRNRVNQLVVVGVFLILLALVRNFGLAAYLLATVLLSYYATLGVTTLFATYWADKPLGQVEWRVPFFLFTILVAVGEDYNILVVTRILQEKKRHGLREGVRRGLAATGGTITACGLIMAGTFGTLMLAQLSTLVQIGFALAVGVLLDTLLVRPLLVPAFMLLVARQRKPAIARPPVATAPLRRAA
jgi:RND superfamily putative drug exporter